MVPVCGVSKVNVHFHFIMSALVYSHDSYILLYSKSHSIEYIKIPETSWCKWKEHKFEIKNKNKCFHLHLSKVSTEPQIPDLSNGIFDS